MSEATFNFRLQTLLDEIEMHPQRDELITLLQAQVADMNNTQYHYSKPLSAA